MDGRRRIEGKRGRERERERGAEGSRRQMREMVAVMGKRESGRGGSSMAEGGREGGCLHREMNMTF